MGRALGKTISYFLAFGFCLPSGDTGMVPGTWNMEGGENRAVFLFLLKVDTRSCCTFRDIAIK